jgi:hypothetical protein
MEVLMNRRSFLKWTGLFALSAGLGVAGGYGTSEVFRAAIADADARGAANRVELPSVLGADIPMEIDHNGKKYDLFEIQTSGDRVFAMYGGEVEGGRAVIIKLYNVPK